MRHISNGIATAIAVAMLSGAADLAAGGATQLGASVTDDYSPCADSGQNCTNDILARASGGGRHA